MKLIILLCCVALSGCIPQPEGESSETSNGDYATKVIHSCEYIQYDNGVFDQRVYSLCHKGNCKFCAERNR